MSIDIDIAVRINCGNCGDSFWTTDLRELGHTAIRLHDHWNENHPGTIHGPRTDIFVAKESSHGVRT